MTNKIFLIAIASLASSVAMADTTSTSTQNVNAVAPSLLDKFTISYGATFSGPALNSLGSPYKPHYWQNPPGDPAAGEVNKANPLMLENTIGVGYKISETMTLTPVFYWLNRAAGGGENKKLSSVMLGDSYLRLKHSNLAEFGGAKLSGDVRYYAPISTASQEKNAIGNIRATQSLDYSIPNSKTSINLTTFARKFFYGDYESSKDYTAPGKKPLTAQVYFGPNVNYQVTESVAVGVLYEAVGVLGGGKSFFSEWDNFGTNLEPGLSWDITKAVNFSPSIAIPVGYRVATDTITIGAGLSWKLL